MAKKRKPEPEPESESSSSSSSSGEYELIEEEIEVTDSDSSTSSESESEPESDKKKEKEKASSEASINDVDEVDPSDREAIRRLVEPFSKEQLMMLLAEAAVQNPRVLERIATSAHSDPEHRKIFVHGLSYDTKTEDLESAFSQFGPIQEVKVVCDKITGRCKGYGFVLFQNRSDAQKALKEPQKRIGERTVLCHLASRGPQQKRGANGGSVQQAIGQVGDLGFLGAFNPLAGLGLVSQTGTGVSNPLAGLGLLNRNGAGQAGGTGVSNYNLGGLGLLNWNGAGQAGTGVSNYNLGGLGALNRNGVSQAGSRVSNLAGLGLLNQNGRPHAGAGPSKFQFQS